MNFDLIAGFIVDFAIKFVTTILPNILPDEVEILLIVVGAVGLAFKMIRRIKI